MSDVVIQAITAERLLCLSKPTDRAPSNFRVTRPRRIRPILLNELVCHGFLIQAYSHILFTLQKVTF